MCLLAFFLLLFNTISVASSRPNEAIDPLLIAGGFEGDILGIDSKQLNRIVNIEAFWEKSVVPFIVDSKLDFIRKRSIEKAMMQLQDQTCLRFIGRQREEDYLHFTDGTGCASHIGRVGGRQDVIVGAECDQVGLVLHLIMHALGFWHEESSDDSPNYVLINWENINEQDQLHFQTYTHRKTNHMSEPFDYQSLMHMSPNAFAINRETPTILSKDERFVLGQRLSLSEGDVNKVMRRYCGYQVSDDDEDVAADDPADNDGRNLGANPIASRTPLALMGKSAVRSSDDHLARITSRCKQPPPIQFVALDRRLCNRLSAPPRAQAADRKTLGAALTPDPVCENSHCPSLPD